MLLKTLQPTAELSKLARAMFKNAWEQRLNQSKSVTNELKQQVVKIESETNQLLDRIVSTTNERVIEAYEKRISNLEKEKRIMEEKLTKTQPKAGRFDEMFELAMTFLSSPWKLWESGQIHWQRTVLRLAFTERLAYCRKTGLRTPELALPFKALHQLSGAKIKLAEREGFEPSKRLTVYTLSRRAPSATRPPLRNL